jgi:ATP-dependent DNA helicase RecQ
MDLTPSLHTHFGFTSFRAGQEEAIQSLLNQNHTLAIMPTGAGKSLIYQFAALQFDGLTLVISPLIALMKDQVDSLNRKGIPATFINSAIPTAEQNQRLTLLAQGKYRLVYVAPERLRNVTFLRSLHSLTLSLLAVDEAHCISEWGHDFRPDYLHIAEARRQLGNPLTVALTATATPKVQSDIVRLLGLPESTKRIVTGFNRPNLTLDVKYTTDTEAKFRALSELLGRSELNSDVQQGATIIYTGTRRDAEEVAEFVHVICKLQAEHYHAGLLPDDRARIQERFINGSTPVIVATNAFGMGIDRADVRQVIHYTLPGSLEAYYQEAGRAGRDGYPARAVLLYDPQDRALQEFFIQNSVVTPDELQLLYRVLGNVDNDVWLTTEDFQRRTELHPVKIKVGLAELERVGALEHLGDDNVRMLLRKGKWDAHAVQQTAGRSREHTRHREDQLNHMLDYAETNLCRRRIVLKHFGDTASPDAPVCCDNCETRKSMPQSANGDVTQMDHAEKAALIILDCIRRVKIKVGRGKLAQILHGSKAQDILSFHHDKNVYYGRLAVVKQSDIEGLISQLVEMKYIKMIGGEYPTLSLTPRGENAIQQKESITLRLPKSLKTSEILHAKAKLSAGGTVEYTAQLLAEGLTPERIAHQRGLTLMTILGHCAKLIEAGKLDVDKVIAKDVKERIEKAIQKAGSIQFLFPIKNLLPDEITYEMIRCVVAARDQSQTSEVSAQSNTEIERLILECVKSLPAQLPRSGVARLLVGSLSERVELLLSHPLYDCLEGKSRSEVMMYVDKLLENGQLQLVEDGYLMLGRANLSAIPITNYKLPNTDYVTRNSQPVSTTDPISSFLSSSHPRPLKGNWHTGFALDFHSSYKGADWNRSGIGDLVYRLKYESDASVLPGLIEHTRTLFGAHPEMSQFDIIVPVPSSAQREFSPVHEFCKALSNTLGKPMQTCVVKTRQAQPQKEMHTLPQKRDNVAGAFALNSDINGKRILLVDDLFDSGATLEEIARLIIKHKAARVNVLTLTRTIHADA